MKLLRIAFAVLLVAAAILHGSDVKARSSGDFGLGLYQTSDLRGFQMIPCFSALVTDVVVLQGGFDFSTADVASFGFLFRGTYGIKEHGDTLINFGAVLEIFDRQTTHVVFAPLIGIDQMLGSSFSLTLDAYPLAVASNAETEVFFLEGRIGATWWF